MSLLIRTFKYRLKQNFTVFKSMVLIVLALAAALVPLLSIGQQKEQTKPVPIGWVDNDNSEYSLQLLDSVRSLVLLDTQIGDEQNLVDKLRSGKLEAVFVVHKGFEQSIKSAEYENTLTMHKSAYSSVAGVISEGVGAQVMHLWLAEYSSDSVAEYGSDMSDKVFDEVMANMVKPIMTIERIGVQKQIEKDDLLADAARESLYISAAVCCLLMLLNSASADMKNFEQRLLTRGLSKEAARLAYSAADTVFFMISILPSVALLISDAAFAKASLYVLMFAMYLFAYGGVASLLIKTRSKTVHMMSITVISIINLAFGSLLLDLPATGIVPKLAYILPSRWLSSSDIIGFSYAIIGLVICAVIYNVLPFILKKRTKEVP